MLFHEHFLFDPILPRTTLTHVSHEDSDTATWVMTVAFFARKLAKCSPIHSSTHTHCLHVFEAGVELSEHVHAISVVHNVTASLDLLRQLFASFSHQRRQLLCIFLRSLMLTLQVLHYIVLGHWFCHSSLHLHDLLALESSLYTFIFAFLFLFFLNKSGYFDCLFTGKLHRAGPFRK